MNASILIIVTSHAKMTVPHAGAADTHTHTKATGLWLEELAVPYRIFTAAGADVTIASPLGGEAPIDPGSLDSTDPEVKAFQADPLAQAKVKNTTRLGDIRGHFDAVFVAGGHGTMWDLPTSPDVAERLSTTWREGGVVAAVCHGPAGLVQAKKADGTPLVAGLKVAAFSNDEERAVNLAEVVPFLLATRLEELGARYEHGPMWQPHVVRDGRLVTGQNPASSAGVARAVLGALGA